MLAATPLISNKTVRIFGQTFGRHDWSIAERYFCSGCLAEDAFHRTFWDLVAFRHCPFHDQPLSCVDRSGQEVPWWSPSFTHSPFGHAIAEHRKRASSQRPTIETYLLGRMGLVDKLPIPLLDSLETCGSALAAVRFAGELALGGRREKRPFVDTFGRYAVIKAGFDVLWRGDQGITSMLEGLVADAGSKADHGLQSIFGWAYRPARRFGAMFTDRMIEVAAHRTGLPRRFPNLSDAKKRLQLTEINDLSKELGRSRVDILKIATRLGLCGAFSPSSIRFVAFRAEETHLLRLTIASLVDRDGAAKMLNVSKRFFNCLVSSGLVRSFIRFVGSRDQFRPEDITTFEKSVTEKVDKLDALPPGGRPLSDVKKTSSTKPAQIVQQLVSGELPLLGRLGDTLGSIIVPASRFSNTWANERRTVRVLGNVELGGARIIDAAAALEVGRPAIVALRRLGCLRASKRSPKLIDTRSIETFKKRYCAARYYAPILNCHPWSTGPRLERLGVKIIRLKLNDGVTRLIDRASARRVLGLKRDPDEMAPRSRQAFIAGLADQIRKSTFFRLVGQANGLVFRTGANRFCIYVTINWECGILEIGPRYNLLRTPKTCAGLRLRKAAIDEAFNGELTWIEDSQSLSVYKSLNKLSFRSPTQWPRIYTGVVELLHDFQMHFELPARKSPP